MKSITAVVAVALALAACDSSPVEQGGEPDITFLGDSVVVGVYKSYALIVTVRDAGGAAQLGVPLNYVSRDPGVASVNAAGAISAGTPGSTYVVVSLSNQPAVRDSVRVRVHADSCSGARPDFGGPATAADRDLFGYDVNAPLNLQKTLLFDAAGVEVSTISFASPDGGTVGGMMWVPVNKQGPRPGIVLMHGLPGTGASMAGLAEQYARYGAVVIAIDAPWNRRGGPELMNTYQDRVEQITVIKDLQRAVDVLRSHPNVNVARIAYVGFSWGGATGALFVGIERRLKAAALVVGHGGQVSHATGPVGHKLIANLPCAQRAAWIRAMAPIEPIRFIGNANVPLLLQNATMDQFIPNADAEELHAAAPQPKTVRWYTAPHGLNAQASGDRYTWLAQMIGIE